MDENNIITDTDEFPHSLLMYNLGVKKKKDQQQAIDYQK
jgi:hypothetical protein